MEKFEYKVVVYDTKGFFGGCVEVNQLENQNTILQTEIDMMEVKIGSNTSINQLEEYAAVQLGMHYPESNECIHLATIEAPEEGLADLIRQKAYA